MNRMEKLDFRTLQSNEIDCRISTVKENGISLLLYKEIVHKVVKGCEENAS